MKDLGRVTYIKSSAPTRIDLAGGTLDIWPLHLFFDNPPTLNAAIDLYATVEITPRKDKKIVLVSHDLGLSDEFASLDACLLYTSPSPRDQRGSRMPSSA